MAQLGPGDLYFPANLDLANILGRTDLHSENFNFVIFWDSGFPDLQIPGFPDSQISRLSARDSQSILRDGSAVASQWLRGAPGSQSAGQPRN